LFVADTHKVRARHFRGTSSAVNGYNQTYGPSWLTPQSVLVARFAKISAQLDF
jgi:hypothetical protein